MDELDALDDIEQLDEDLAAYDEEITAFLVALTVKLLDSVRELLDRLELNGRATTAEQVKANLRAAIMWRAELPNLLVRLGFSAFVDSITAKMLASSIRINQYYGVVEPGFIGSQYNDIVTALTNQTRQLLSDAVVNTYGPMLDEVLNWGVMTKVSQAEMRANIVAKLPSDGVAIRHVGQVASDALYTFSRGYAQAVAEGLNLQHYFYMGTRIATTRGFCNDRLGKPYTQKEIESWAELTWSGKIPGTTKVSIFWYVGGFRCRHRLLPISKRAYNYLLNNPAGNRNN